MKPIDKGRLAIGKQLGKGGMAEVFLVDNSVPGLPGELAYKQLLPTLEAKDRRPMLDTMRQAIAVRDKMNPAEQQELDSLTVWPLAMVEHQGNEVGMLMRRIPDTFLIDAKDGPRLFEFQLLVADADQAKANGFDLSRARADKDLVRLALMARLAYAIEVIHRPRGGVRLVYGDMSLRNAAVATDPTQILLMDCDGVADVNDPTRLQPNTPFFVPPEIKTKQQKLQDQATDVYKLALCVIRGLSTGRGATQLSDPASPLVFKGLLDQTGIDLLNRALGADRAQRPTAEDIKDYLIGRVLDLADPPTLLSAELSTDVTLRGSEVFVRWTHKGATSVRIFSDVGNFSVKVPDPDGHPNGFPIKPPTACEVRVAVVNDHGEDQGPAGRLHYFEIPPLDITVNPPSVVLPDLPAMRLPKTHSELPPYPMPAADAVPLPPLNFPHVPSVDLAAVAPRAPLGRGLLDAISHAYRAADAGIDATIGDVLRRRAQKLRADAEKNVPTP